MAYGTDRLQSPHPEAAAWFLDLFGRAIRENGLEEYFRQYPTVQGVWFTDAAGASYGLLQDHEAESTLAAFARVREEYRRREHPPLAIPAESVADAEPTPAEPGAATMRLYYRCTPAPEGAHPVNRLLGRDHLWVFASEVQELIDLSAPGGNFDLPDRLMRRLARFHLLDNVRGLADPFEPREVTKAKATVRVREMRADRRVLAFTGEWAAEKDYPGDANYSGKLGVEGRIEGEIVLDLASGSITRFRALAEGQAWGANSNTWHQPPGRFPLVIAIVEADDAIARTLAPAWWVPGWPAELAEAMPYVNPLASFADLEK